MRNRAVNASQPPPRPSQRRRRLLALLWARASLAGAAATAAGTWAACRAFDPPLGFAWLGFGAIVLGVLFALDRLRPPAAVGLFAGALALGVVGGLGAHSFAAPPADVARTDPNREVAAQVLRVGQALERHANRDARALDEPAYPDNEAFAAFLARLPAKDVPLENPFGRGMQRNHVAAGGDTGLPTAAEHRAGAPAPILNRPLGPGEPPGEGPYTARTYGALVYDHDPKSDSYVLYGIGKQGEMAVLVAKTDGAP
jgi:hypothetical protein